MEISLELLSERLAKITLSGRLDIAGSEQIETRFAGMTATPNTNVIVDLSQVEFLASMGIRALIANARAVQRRGGRLVLAAATPTVANVLQVTGIEALIPLFSSLADAVAALSVPAADR